MMHVHDAVRTSPFRPQADAELMSRCIETCLDAVQNCTAAADASFGKDAANLGLLMRLCQDTTDLSQATARILSRQHSADVDVIRHALRATQLAARKCADEAERHGNRNDPFQICADTCRRLDRVASSVDRALQAS